MPAKRPNYNQTRGDRNRAKDQKRQERLRRREEDSLRRRADRESDAPIDTAAEAVPSPAFPSPDESSPKS
jgi:hypothetical protein